METRLIIIGAITVGYFALMSWITYSVRRHANSSDGMTAGGRNYPAPASARRAAPSSA